MSEPLSWRTFTIGPKVIWNVAPGHPWDFKNLPKPLNPKGNNPYSQYVGNYNYGAVMTSAGMPEYFSLLGAGIAQLGSDFRNSFRPSLDSETNAARENILKAAWDLAPLPFIPGHIPGFNLFFGDHGDRPGDQDDIQRGYEDYSPCN